MGRGTTKFGKNSIRVGRFREEQWDICGGTEGSWLFGVIGKYGCLDDTTILMIGTYIFGRII